MSIHCDTRAAYDQARYNRRIAPWIEPMRTQATLLDRCLASQRRWLSLIGHVFPPSAVVDEVVTRAGFDASPDDVFRRIMFYEEVPKRPPLLLRILLPVPLTTHKSDICADAIFECSYSGGGHLMKRLTAVEAPQLVRFEVIEQHLGIERCLTTVAGSYEIRANGDRSEVALTTRYRGHLRPRWLWRMPERILAHQLHRHILGGMGADA